MGFYEHEKSVNGIPVQEFKVEDQVTNLSGAAWRISIDWDAYEDGVKFLDRFAKMLDTPGIEDVEAFIVGCWEGGAEGDDNAGVVEALVAARDKLSSLKYLFIGDILQEECEVSWIIQTDLSPLFLAFPNLETFKVRGADGLSLGRPVHEKLQSLIVEGGGLPGSVVREICTGELPSLSHLELWLGNDGYGRDVSDEDLRPILQGEAFPNLKYLGLRNDNQADEMVEWLDDAGILAQLDTLDLSLGSLSDAGANALCQNAELKKLKRLDIHYHFVSDETLDKLKTHLPNVEIDASERQEADTYDDEIYRYNFVSE